MYSDHRSDNTFFTIDFNNQPYKRLNKIKQATLLSNLIKGNSYRRFIIRNYDGLTEKHLSDLANYSPGLIELRLENCSDHNQSFLDAGLVIIVKKCTQLQILALDGSLIYALASGGIHMGYKTLDCLNLRYLSVNDCASLTHLKVRAPFLIDFHKRGTPLLLDLSICSQYSAVMTQEALYRALLARISKNDNCYKDLDHWQLYHERTAPSIIAQMGESEFFRDFWKNIQHRPALQVHLAQARGHCRWSRFIELRTLIADQLGYSELGKDGNPTTAHYVARHLNQTAFAEFWASLDGSPDVQSQLATMKLSSNFKGFTLAHYIAKRFDAKTFLDFWLPLPIPVKQKLAQEKNDLNDTVTHWVLGRFDEKTVIRFWDSLVQDNINPIDNPIYNTITQIPNKPGIIPILYCFNGYDSNTFRHLWKSLSVESKREIALFISNGWIFAQMAMKHLSYNIFRNELWNVLSDELKVQLITEVFDHKQWSLLHCSVLYLEPHQLNDWMGALQALDLSPQQWKTLLIDQKDTADFNLVMLASRYHPRYLTSLLRLLPQDVRQQFQTRRNKYPEIDALGNTKMHQAAYRGAMRQLAQLKSSGHKLDALNQANQSVAHWAVRSGSLNAIKWVIQHAPSLLHQTDVYNNTLIDYAMIEAKRVGILPYVNIINYLLAKNVSFNARFEIQLKHFGYLLEGKNTDMPFIQPLIENENEMVLEHHPAMNNDAQKEEQAEEKYPSLLPSPSQSDNISVLVHSVNEIHMTSPHEQIKDDDYYEEEEKIISFAKDIQEMTQNNDEVMINGDDDYLLAALEEIPDNIHTVSLQEQFFLGAQQGTLNDDWLDRDIDIHAVDPYGDHALTIAIRAAIYQKLLNPTAKKTLFEINPSIEWLKRRTKLHLTDAEINGHQKRLQNLTGLSIDCIDTLDQFKHANDYSQKRVIRAFDALAQNTDEKILRLFYYRMDEATVARLMRHFRKSRPTHIEHIQMRGIQEWRRKDLDELITFWRDEQLWPVDALNPIRTLEISEMPDLFSQSNKQNSLTLKVTGNVSRTVLMTSLINLLKKFNQLEYLDLHRMGLQDAHINYLIEHLYHRSVPLLSINIEDNPDVSSFQAYELMWGVRYHQDRAYLLGNFPASPDVRVSPLHRIMHYYRQVCTQSLNLVDEKLNNIDVLDDSIKAYRWLYETIEQSISVLADQANAASDDGVSCFTQEAVRLKAFFDADKDHPFDTDNHRLLRPEDNDLTDVTVIKQLALLKERCLALSLSNYFAFHGKGEQPALYKLMTLINRLEEYHRSKDDLQEAITEEVDMSRMSQNQVIFKHHFSRQLGNMYTVSQVYVTGLIKVDKYLTAWENNKKIGKDILFGLSGFIGGAGHFLEAGDKILGVLETITDETFCETLKKGINYGIAHGGAIEMVENGLHTGHVIRHDIVGHGGHESHAKPGQWQNTKAQLNNLNQVFSHDSEFNTKHDELALHIAFHYAEQIDALSLKEAATFGQACAEHWLEALKMNYVVFPRDKSSSQFSAKGLAWMAYVDIHRDYTKKIKYRGQFITANDLLKKPAVKTNYRLPKDKPADKEQPVEAPVYFDWQSATPTHICKALKKRIATVSTDVKKFGYRLAFKQEVNTAKTNQSGQLIHWPHAFTLGATPHFVESGVIDKKLYQHLEHMPCPYAQTWVLEQRVKYLEQALSEQKLIQDKLVNKQSIAYKEQKKEIEGMEKQLESQQKELVTLKQTVENQNKFIKNLHQENKKLKREVNQNSLAIKQIKLNISKNNRENKLNESPPIIIENGAQKIEEENNSHAIQSTHTANNSINSTKSLLQQNSLFELGGSQQENDKASGQQPTMIN